MSKTCITSTALTLKTVQTGASFRVFPRGRLQELKVKPQLLVVRSPLGADTLKLGDHFPSSAKENPRPEVLHDSFLDGFSRSSEYHTTI